MQMKRLFTILAVALGFVSCELETSDNGDLDGFWLLTSVDTLATGGHLETRDSSLTWAFQGRILEIRRSTYRINECFICKFEHAGGTIRVYDIYQIARDKEEDPRVEDVSILCKFGVNALDERFRVVRLDDDTMILQSNGLQINFCKY